MCERPDVPKGGKHANLIAAVALLVIAVAAVALVSTLWRLANENSKLGDAALADALAALASVYGEDGVEGLAVALASGAGLAPDHVVVMSTAGRDAFIAVAQQGSSVLEDQASELMGGIERTDMDVAELLDIAKQALSSGISADAIEAAPTREASDDTGSWAELDAVQLGLAVGSLRATA